jgi:hypothetical protein
MPYDIFISYSRRYNEQGRVTQLVERIKQDFAPVAKSELVPFFDVDEIHGMPFLSDSKSLFAIGFEAN